MPDRVTNSSCVLVGSTNASERASEPSKTCIEKQPPRTANRTAIVLPLGLARRARPTNASEGERRPDPVPPPPPPPIVVSWADRTRTRHMRFCAQTTYKRSRCQLSIKFNVVFFSCVYVSHIIGAFLAQPCIDRTWPRRATAHSEQTSHRRP